MIIYSGKVKVRQNTMSNYFYGMIQKHLQELAPHIGKYVKVTIETMEDD